MSLEEAREIKELEKESRSNHAVMEQQSFKILELQREISKLEKVIIKLVQDNLLKGGGL